MPTTLVLTPMDFLDPPTVMGRNCTVQERNNIKDTIIGVELPNPLFVALSRQIENSSQELDFFQFSLATMGKCFD